MPDGNINIKVPFNFHHSGSKTDGNLFLPVQFLYTRMYDSREGVHIYVHPDV